MVSQMLNSQNCPFFNWQTVKIIVFNCFSHEQTTDWPINTSCLFLNPINISKILQIFITVILILHIFFDAFSQLSLNFCVLSNEINHGHHVMRSSVSSGNKECAEFFQNFCLRIEFFIIFCFRIYICSNQCFDDIFWFSCHTILFNSFSSNINFRFDEVQTPIPEYSDSSIDISVLRPNSKLHKFYSQNHWQEIKSLQDYIGNQFVDEHTDRHPFQCFISCSSQKAFQHNTGKHPDSQIDDVILNDIFIIFYSMIRCFFHISNGLSAKLFNFRSHGFYKVKVKNGINNSPFSFPFFSLTKWYSSTHCPNDRSS